MHSVLLCLLPFSLVLLGSHGPHLTRNKSDKIRDCISPLGSPSLKRVSCLRGGGLPDITHQTFVTFQWASYFFPPHLVRHQPIIDRLWIREVEGGNPVLSADCCYLCLLLSTLERAMGQMLEEAI